MPRNRPVACMYKAERWVSEQKESHFHELEHFSEERFEAGT